MRYIGLSVAVAGALLVAGRPDPAGAQAVGSEFRINSYTTSWQRPGLGHVTATDSNGNFVVVWQSSGQDGSKYGVFAQRFDSAGVPRGGEFRVNSYTRSNQDSPSVAADASGNFVVVWESRRREGFDVFGKRYDSGGLAQGDEFRVNSYPTSSQRAPSVASDASGDFVVVWNSKNQDGDGYGVFGQRYDSAGRAAGSEFRVNSYTTGAQGGYWNRPSVASDASGNFVVAWASNGQDGDGSGVFGQRYDSAGIALGAEFRVNSYTVNDQYAPSVASDASGNFVVVWTSYWQDGYAAGIFGQRYDSDGVAQGAEFQVNSHWYRSQLQPSVAVDPSSNFVVVWQDYNYASSWIVGQRYDSAGAALGGEFKVSSYLFGYTSQPSVSMTGVDRFIVAWESGLDVYGRRFDFSANAASFDDRGPR